MKKSLLIFASILSLLFTSCFQPAFYNVTQDVPPEQATVFGVINSLVRYATSDDPKDEFLVVAANGGIRYKKATASYHSPWYTYTNLPFTLHSFNATTNQHTGEEIIKVFADATHLYFISTSYRVDETLSLSVPDVVSVYAKKITSNGDLWSTEGSWKLVASGPEYFNFYISEGYVYSSFNAFCTNSVQRGHRRAFLRCGKQGSTNTYYQLDGTTEPKIEITGGLNVFPGETAEANLNSAVYFGDKCYFFNSIASTTDETTVDNAKHIYYGKGLSLMYCTTSKEPTMAIANCSTPISCLAVCSDAILIGRGDYSDTIYYTTGGITKTSLNADGVPGSSLLDFTTNAQIQLSEAYLILTLLNVDPSKPELESTFYASLGFAGSGSSTTASVNYKNIGLWSYYPSRGNWNCE